MQLGDDIRYFLPVDIFWYMYYHTKGALYIFIRTWGVLVRWFLKLLVHNISEATSRLGF